METQELNIPTLKVTRKYYLELPLGLLSAEIATILEKKKEGDTYVFTLGGKQIIADEREEEKMRMFLSSGFNHDGEPITKEEYKAFLKAVYAR